MPPDLTNTYERLFNWASERDLAGHDPFDGLNSKVIQWTPLRHFAHARLAFLQLIKRGPAWLRSVLLVPEGRNPKALALFALAELSRYRASNADIHSRRSRELLNKLLVTGIEGSTADGEETLSFGYNFDWQSRVLWAPRGTPAVVPTAFASQAFFEAHTAFGDDSYADAVAAVARFVAGSLNRTGEADDEVCFSYTPADHSQVFNASLLAAECLARAAVLQETPDYARLAENAVRFVVRRQNANSSWAYGTGEKQAWVDNFHTAYVLLSIRRIVDMLAIREREFGRALAQGSGYWLEHHFLPDGTPKYYDNEVYPVDIHAAAVAIAALSEFGEHEKARRVTEWTIANMLGNDGAFYYQIRNGRTVRTPFMRWGQAWMAYALARSVEAG